MENGSSSLYWYALRTKSRFEKVVRGELMRRGIEQLLPTITRTSQWKDRKKQIEWPLFPGYCFARFSTEQKLIVLQTPGIIEIVGGGSRPEPIEEEEMEALRRMISSHRYYDPYPYLN